MASGYSKIVEFECQCGTPAAIELPMPPRGVLERVIMTQVDGDAEEATCNIYDRKGACVAANDLNVAHEGTVAGIADNGGSVQVTTVDPHNLIVGDEIEIKNCLELSYNGLQTVVAVISDTVVVTNKPYIANENAGPLWQTKPFDPTTAPITHLMYTFEKTAGADYKAFDINQAYENKDNQSPTMRARYSAMWLEILTVGAVETLKFQVAYTCRADTVV